MSKNLLIVESPSKARTVKRYLGRDYQVVASVGHIKDLPEKELGIDIKRNFKPRYVTIKGKSRIIRQLRDAAANAADIYLAPDPDREGEAIAWHIANTLKENGERIHRVLFNEITPNGVRDGLKHPRQIDLNLVNAQQARRILDRLVGYQVSPFLWKTLFRGLSAGRVQSVALRIICEREAEIERFKPREYWEIFADFETPKQEQFTAKCIKIGRKKPDIPDEQTVKELIAALKDLQFTVAAVEEKTVKKSPSPPFTTSTLQQEAARRYKYPSSKTMKIAQQLYEGIDVGGETVGLITYMRTDSVRISKGAIDAIRAFIAESYGPKYLPKNPRYFRTKKQNVQDAHEGIRPTRFDLDPDRIADSLSPDQKRLYSLIWNRFAACQMATALYKRRTIDVSAGEYLFRASRQQLYFEGFLKAFRSEKKEEDKATLPTELKVRDALELLGLKPEQKFTEPPSRFTEGTLVRELDSLGIGRPSTYASIVSTIFTRKYIERKSGNLVPTRLGKTVNDLLVSGMPGIFSVRFTAGMEADLDLIESNRKAWLDVIREFYASFRRSLDRMESHQKEIKENLQEKTDETCDLCGAPMVIKWSRNGRFLACSAFPECKNTRPLEAIAVEKSKTRTCPNCGGEMIVKEGRYGKFWACSNYPKCKTTAPLTLNIHCPEPDCDGFITEKKTRKGKTFWGCSNYPKCRFASWRKPVDRACKACQYPLLVERQTRQGELRWVCPKCRAQYEPE